MDGLTTYQSLKSNRGHNIIYFWVYVIVDHLGYQGLGRSHNVTGECLFYYYGLIQQVTYSMAFNGGRSPVYGVAQFFYKVFVFGN